MKLKNIHISNKIVSRFVFSTLVILLTFLCADMIRTSIISLSGVVESPQLEDFELSDIYERAYDSSPIKDLADKIVVVCADEISDRAELAVLLDSINAYKPSAIGMDYYFEEQHNSFSDSMLEASIIRNSVIVTSNVYNGPGCVTIFKRIPKNQFGFMNLAKKSNVNNAVVRTFFPYLKNSKGENVKSIDVLLAERVINIDHKYKQEFNTEHRVRFSRREIDVLNYNVLINGTQLEKEYVNNKIVLIGDINNEDDLHVTPLSGNYQQKMPGVLIHAHIVDTLINNYSIETLGKGWTYFFTILLMYSFVFFMIWSSENIGNLANIAIRIIQFLFVIGFLYLGYYLYTDTINPLYVDFSWVALMIACSCISFDVLLGMKETFKILRNKIL